jgi:branched-subunit amino acid permease
MKVHPSYVHVLLIAGALVVGGLLAIPGVSRVVYKVVDKLT